MPTVTNRVTTRTLTIIKPDAFGRGLAGKILAHLEGNGFKVVAAQVAHLSTAEAGAFYEVHRERPFFSSLVTFMTSGPCMPIVLERADAVATLRAVIGATDPKDAAPGTVRALFAESKERNAIHASDSDDNASREAGFFFAERELIARS
ncbi:MAG TPA: nucleoside-diphosphate kinase [Gemmatimonadaceae bacterium]|jgi:nucleoside-diphosphate kinase|nr:nucleoside-diphosphate kinase [Gemmatimonadaceae bacterium]